MERRGAGAFSASGMGGVKTDMRAGVAAGGDQFGFSPGPRADTRARDMGSGMDDLVFWVPAALITLIAGGLAVLGLMRGARALPEGGGARRSLRVYADQLREIERDSARGLIPADEAERLRTETARRLLEADRALGGQSAGQAPVPMRWLAVGLILGAVGIAGWVYAVWGAPLYADRALATRHAEAAALRAQRPGQAELEVLWLAAPEREAPPEPDPEFAALMDQLRGAVAGRPDDLAGHRLLAQNEARLGRFAEAAVAQGRVVALLPQGTTLDEGIGEQVRQAQFLIAAAGGVVSPEAERVLESILRRDPENGFARFFVGVMFDQTGRPDLTFQLWRRLLEDSTPDAPWVPDLRASLETLAAVAGVRYSLPPEGAGPRRGPTAAEIEAAAGLAPEDRAAMIGGMVDGLMARLASAGGPAEDWAQLVRALGVMGDPARARAIWVEARLVFVDDPAGMAVIDAAARDAGLVD
jgi:cytochrome c-type biogenesis protein CcmH